MFRDPTMMNCPNFGMSGSGVLIPFRVSEFLQLDKNIIIIIYI